MRVPHVENAHMCLGAFVNHRCATSSPCQIESSFLFLISPPNCVYSYVEKLFKVNKDQMEGMGMQDVDFITAQNMKEFHIDGEDDDDEDEEESESHVAEAKPPPEAPTPAPAPAPVE